ncbi:hypothetical protein [Patulibacter defluvii]|uniref:hypothetical protein n=1 Tax=Patulibacter defluvii TaxID=3095358 RepID=UPI002A75818B|nr:hypothetical protein [Patulibacter sp. DM4]
MESTAITVTAHEGRPVVLAPDRGATVTAGLAFRVGWADEPIRLHGITHLVEHLAHAHVPDRTVRHNASVDETTTEFWVRGAAAEVTAHLQALLDALARPPVDQLARERGVLRAEGGAPLSPLLARRFANRGFGTASWDQFALETATEDDVRRWAAEWFVAANLCLWSTAPLAAELRLSVPAGESAAWPLVERGPDCALPAHLVWDYGAVGWSGETDAGWAGSLATEILEQRARERLRHEMGRSYAVHNATMILGPQRRLRSLVADHEQRGDPVPVRDVLLRDLDDLAERGPAADELARLVGARVRALDEPDTAPSLASLGARQLLLGAAVEGPDELRAAWRGVEPEQVRRAAAQLRESLLLAVPASARPADAALPPIDRRRGDDAPVDAPRYRCGRARQGLRDRFSGGELRLEEGVGLSATRGGRSVRIPFADVTVVVVVDEIDVHAYDGADRVVSACVHDEEDERRWLRPLLRAVGPERTVRIDTGRRRQLARMTELAGSQLGSRAALGGRLYEGSYALNAHEQVVGLAAARIDGDEVVLVLTEARLLWLLADDWRWIDLHEIHEAVATEGWRSGTLRVTLERTALVADRVRAKGRASALAAAINERGAAIRATAPIVGEPEPAPAQGD